MSKILELLKSGGLGVTYLAQSGDHNHMLQMPTGKDANGDYVIRQHSDFGEIRANDPDRTLLSASMAETGGPIYPIAVYCESQAGELIIFVADGHQRLASARDNGDEFVVAIWRDTWVDVETAIGEVASLNWSRYELGDLDVVSLLQTGLKTQAEIAKITGYTESKVNRLAKIKDYAWLVKAVLGNAEGKNKIIPLSVATKLVDECEGNAEKLDAFKATYQEKFAKAEAQAKFQANKIKTQNRKWKPKDRAAAKVNFYFRGMDWNSWIDIAAADDGIVDGKLNLDDSVAKKTNAVTIGSPDEWEKEFAVRGLFGSKIDDVAKEDVQYVLDHWSKLGAALQAVVDGKPVPTIENPVVEIDVPPPPAKQDQELEPEPVGQDQDTDENQ